MPVIDVHTHVLPQYAQVAVEVMDECELECVVTLEWHNGFGEALREHLAIFNAHPGRFVVFGNVDFGRINEPGFGEAAASQMEKDVEAGMRGLKAYKALGLKYRDANGELWHVSDERLDPIWAKAGELGLPVLLHTADPPAFWEPVNDFNFWNIELRTISPDWSYYRKGLAGPDELLGERNEVVRRHPGTTFICPHVGSRASCLDSAADDLEEMPNLYCDLAARIPIMGRSARRAAHSREFLIDHQDRILFGTDLICDEAPGDGDSKREYLAAQAVFYQSHLDFLMTSKVQVDPPFERTSRGYSITGVDLPKEVCDKILHQNARRLLAGTA